MLRRELLGGRCSNLWLPCCDRRALMDCLDSAWMPLDPGHWSCRRRRDRSWISRHLWLHCELEPRAFQPASERQLAWRRWRGAAGAMNEKGAAWASLQTTATRAAPKFLVLHHDTRSTPLSPRDRPPDEASSLSFRYDWTACASSGISSTKRYCGAIESCLTNASVPRRSRTAA
jgi:hypothetical protein